MWEGLWGQMGKARLTGDSQVGGCLHLTGRVAGEALEHAGVIGHQPADLQAPIATLPEAAQPGHLNHSGVLVPGDGRWRHPWGQGERDPPLASLLPPSFPPLRPGTARGSLCVSVSGTFLEVHCLLALGESVVVFRAAVLKFLRSSHVRNI